MVSPPLRDQAAEGWGTQFMEFGKGGPPAFGMNVASIALPALLILVDLLCFDRYKIDYSHWASKSLRIETVLPRSEAGHRFSPTDSPSNQTGPATGWVRRSIETRQHDTSTLWKANRLHEPHQGWSVPIPLSCRRRRRRALQSERVTAVYRCKRATGRSLRAEDLMQAGDGFAAADASGRRREAPGADWP